MKYIKAVFNALVATFVVILAAMASFFTGIIATILSVFAGLGVLVFFVALFLHEASEEDKESHDKED